VAIVSSRRDNGTIVALSEEARQEEGLYQGLRTAVARKMSPRVNFLPYNSSLYSHMHHFIYDKLSNYSPVVEPAEPGRYYLDMTGMGGVYDNIENTGYEITQKIEDKANLESKIGISPNKLVSNISTQVVPRTLHTVERGEEPSFLAPLRSKILPSTDRKEVQKILQFLFLKKVRELQEIVEDEDVGRVLFADNYKKLALEARGQDNSAVKPPQFQDHIVKQMTLEEDTNDREKLEAAVITLAEQLGYELRKKQKVAGKVNLEIHYADGYKNTRNGEIETNDNQTVTSECLKLFDKANYRRNRVRTILIDGSQLQPASRQMSLFGESREKQISRTVDSIRDEYGFDSIKTASGMMIEASELGIKN